MRSRIVAGDTRGRAAAWLADEAGGSLVEYIFIVALIAVVAMGATAFLGSAVVRQFDVAARSLEWSGTGRPLPPAIWTRR
jgi:Flp pilus assembly pilin Flp